MPILIERDHADVPALGGDEPLRVPAAAFAAATGWVLRPEGLCRGTACVPVAGTGIVDGDTIDVTAFADRMGQALVVDHERGVAAIGGDPMSRGQGASLADVTLPGVYGGQVDFADFLGEKTLLIAWAAW